MILRFASEFEIGMFDILRVLGKKELIWRFGVSQLNCEGRLRKFFGLSLWISQSCC